MRHLGQRDRQVWGEFKDHHSRLRAVADAIRAEASQQQATPLAPEDGEDEAQEGRILYRRPPRPGARPRARQAQKQHARQGNGRLACEVCTFDFETVYGRHGAGYIECHHTVPLAQAAGPRTTRLEDLAVVCSNCHRMLHRGDPPPTLMALREAIRSHGLDGHEH